MFAPEEISRIKSLLLQLYRCRNLRPSKVAARRVRDFLSLSLQRDESVLRDVFGINKIVLALETVLQTNEEVELGGSAAIACLVDSVLPREDETDEVRRVFGDEIHNLLKGFVHSDRLDTNTNLISTDDYRNLYVSQAGDMRVLLLLIVRCLCRMRQLKDTEHLEERRKLSNQAAHIFAPLAHKLGLYAIKSELEDLSLKYLETEAYYHIKEKLNATKKARDAYIVQFTSPIREMLDAEGLKYTMKGRTKSIHSIWQKMQKQHCAFEGVYDLFAIRIILDASPKQELAQCWKVFSIITDRYESNLNRLRDWLTVPKSNGYESLHITVLGPNDKWVEVQIRSSRMDEIAEHGLAAHWRYKGIRQGERGIDSWLAGIRSALESGDDGQLGSSLTLHQEGQNIYVFTPKGDLFKLPPHATLLDFAYHIHTAVGNRCVGGKIDGRNVPLRQELKSGQTVEIVTSNSQTPKPEWLHIVVSAHARDKIRSAVKELQARESVLGREQLERRLKNRKLVWDETIVNHLVRRSGYKEAIDFFKDIASGKLDIAKVLELYAEIQAEHANAGTPAQHTAVRSAEEYTLSASAAAPGYEDRDVLVIDRNLKGIDFQMARCCNPAYGDDVFGFVSVTGGIKIHRTNCPNAPALQRRYGYRIVPARWAGKGGGQYPVSLRIVGNDDLGIVNNITGIIAKEEKTMLRNINIDSDDGLFSGLLTLTVDNVDRLEGLIKKLRTVKGVKNVERL